METWWGFKYCLVAEKEYRNLPRAPLPSETHTSFQPDPGVSTSTLLRVGMKENSGNLNRSLSNNGLLLEYLIHDRSLGCSWQTCPSRLQGETFSLPPGFLWAEGSSFIALECLWAEMFLNLPRGRQCFYPSKAVCCENILEKAVNTLCSEDVQKHQTHGEFSLNNVFLYAFSNRTHRQSCVCQKIWILNFQAVRQITFMVLETSLHVTFRNAIQTYYLRVSECNDFRKAIFYVPFFIF